MKGTKNGRRPSIHFDFKYFEFLLSKSEKTFCTPKYDSESLVPEILGLNRFLYVKN